jgi:hypothetical protein
VPERDILNRRLQPLTRMVSAERGPAVLLSEPRFGRVIRSLGTASVFRARKVRGLSWRRARHVPALVERAGGVGR